MRERGGASRRSFLVLAAGGGAGVLLGACGSGDKGTQQTTTDQTNLGGSATAADLDVLNATLELEHRSVAAYAAGVAQMSARLRATAERFGEQESEHVDALAKAIRELGGSPVEPKDPDDYGFPALEDQEAALEFAMGVENTALAWYIDALPKLSSPELRATAASIATVEAEQLAVLLGAAGRPQVPEAFVLGKKTT